MNLIIFLHCAHQFIHMALELHQEVICIRNFTEHYFQKTALYLDHGTLFWNNLNPDIKKSRSLKSFSNKLKHHLLNMY